ncbi:MAG: O-antigen ligase family protein [Solirubrobacteraceae bacterium]
MSVNSVGAWNTANRFASKRSLAAVTLVAGGCVMLLALAAVLAEILSRNPPSLAIAVGGCLLLALGLVLVLARYDLAVFIGFLLLAVVLVEPAPGDALFGLIMAVAAVTGRFGIKRVPRAAVCIVTAFLLINVISLTDVISWSAATRFFAATLYLGLFSLWLAAYIDRPSRARMLVRAYLFVAVLSAGLTSVALFIHFPESKLLIGDGERGKGLFKDPNVYGPFLIPMALILAEEIFNPRLLRLRRPFKFACFLVLTLGVVFSYSRAAWLSFAIGLIVLIAIAVLRSPDRRAISLLIVVLVSGVATAGTIVGTGSLGFLSERAKLQNYDTQRFGAQSFGLKTGLEHPFGVGPGQFDVISPVSSHSLYVRSLSEQGLLGLLAIVALVVGTLAFAAANVLHGRDTYGISAAALLAAWCGLAANSFFVDTLHWRVLWLIAALIWAGAMRRRSATGTTEAMPALRAAAQPSL